MDSLNQLAPTQQKDDIAGMLVNIKNRVEQILPKMIGPERVMQSMAHCIRLQPTLMNCTRDSLLAALLQSAREGLEIGVECHLVPRSNRGVLQVVYQRDFRGELTLARRSGEYAAINCGVCCEHDQYEILQGTDNRLEIKLNLKHRGNPLFYWCSSELKDGGQSFTIMSHSEAEEHREKYAPRNKNNQVVGPWIDHFEAMALKTVVKRHLKYQPKAYERMIEVADERVLGLDSGLGDLPAPLPEPEQPTRLEAPPEGVDPVTGEIKQPEKQQEDPGPQERQQQDPGKGLKTQKKILSLDPNNQGIVDAHYKKIRSLRSAKSIKAWRDENPGAELQPLIGEHAATELHVFALSRQGHYDKIKGE